MGRKGDSAATRERLLEAACRVFAEKGYKGATIAKICRRAGANIAAVNYYFGNKETLYKEAWRHAFRAAEKKYPLDGGVSPTAPPEEQLRGRIRSLIFRIADEDSCEFDITHRELANPTGLLREIIRKALDPRRETVRELIRQLLGPGATERQVRFCHASIIGQCFHLMRMRRLRRCGRAGHPPVIEIDDIEAYADHVVKFSLAGIRAIREETPAGGGSGTDEEAP